MAKTAINTIKTWFETGDFPTQQQFWNWLDSFWHKDDMLPIANVDGLNEILIGKATTEETDSLQMQINNLSAAGEPVEITVSANKEFTISAGKLLEKIVVIPTAALASFSVGTASDGSDIMPGIPVAAGDAEVFTLNKYANGDTVIWFNGLTSETTIKIYIR